MASISPTLLTTGLVEDVELVEDLRAKVDRWTGFAPCEKDAIVAEALEAFRAKSAREAVRFPLRWLLRTAKLLGPKVRRERINGVEGTVYDLSTFELPSIHSPRGDEDLRRVMEDALNIFTEEQRECIRLCLVEEMTPAEAARCVGSSRSTVKSWIDRAKKRLAQVESLRSYAITRKSRRKP